MLILSKELVNKKILSLRTNAPIGSVVAPIVNPNNLSVVGFYCQDRFNKKSHLVLLAQDIRDTLSTGYIVNDHDVLSEVEDLVRLQDIIKLSFDPIGKPVETVSGQKVGKVSEYATDLKSMYIQKLYVSQPLYKNFSGGNMVVDRNQINEITPKRVIINDLLGTVPVQARASII